MSGNDGFAVGFMDRFRVEKAGEPILQLDYRKHEEAFAYILLCARTPTPVEDVALALWPEKSTEAACNRLYETTFKIRRQLEDVGMDENVIQTRRGLIFADPNLELDVDRFTNLCETVIRMPEKSSDSLIEPLRASFGEGFLPGLNEPWARNVRHHLRTRYEHAIALSVISSGSTSIGAIPLNRLVQPEPVDSRENEHLDVSSLQALGEKLVLNLFNPEREYWFRRTELVIDVVKRTIEQAIVDEDFEVAVDLSGRFWHYWWCSKAHENGWSTTARSFPRCGTR